MRLRRLVFLAVGTFDRGPSSYRPRADAARGIMTPYDIFILMLILIGTIGALFCAFTLSHSSVYPVGIVHDRTTQKLERHANLDAESQSRSKPEVAKKGSHIVWENEFETDALDKLMQCDHCGLCQAASKGPICVSCGHPLPASTEKWESPFGHVRTPLENKVSQLEERIKRLEDESVKKSLKAEEEEHPAAREYVQ